MTAHSSLPSAGAVAAALAASALGAAMAASAWHLWPEAQASATSMEALAQVRSWQAPRAKAPDTGAWLQTRASLAQALQRTPDNAELNEAMAYLYLLAARRPQQSPLVNAPYLKQALEHLKLATAARPMVSSAWANAALAFHQLAAMETTPGQSTQWLPGLWSAFDRAMYFGHRSQGVQQSLGAIAFSRWAELGPQRQQAVTRMVANAPPAQQRALLAQASAQRVALKL